MTRASLDILLCGLLVALVAALLAAAAAIRPPAQVFPLTVLILTGGMALAALVQAVARRRRGEGGGAILAAGSRLEVGAIAAALVAYVAVMRLGYLAATFVFLLGLYLLLNRPLGARVVARSIVIAALVTGFVYLVFAHWLGVNLPR